MVKDRTAGQRMTERGNSVALKALTSHGEAFMSMFEDSEEARPLEEATTSDGSSDSEDQKEAMECTTPDKASGSSSIEELDFGTSRSKQAGGITKPQTLTKKQRRMFMSGKAADVHTEAVDIRSTSGRKDRSVGGLTPTEFKDLRREVDTFGAVGLDKRQRKLFDAASLTRLNAKVEKQPRIPASIGKGMAAYRAERQQRELQEAIDAGMVQQKGLGKKKQRAKEQARRADRGLMEDNGAFRNGKLLVKGLKGDRIVKKRKKVRL